MKPYMLKKAVTILTVVSVIITLISVAFNFLLPIYLFSKLHIDRNEASSIGIIGGADGPTAIYVTGQQSSHFISAIFALFSIVGITYLIFVKRIKR